MRLRAAAVAALCLGLTAAAVPVHAQAAPVRVGRVDMAKVFEKWGYYQSANKDLESLGKGYKQRIEERQNRYSFLLPEEYDLLKKYEEKINKGAALTLAERTQYDRLLGLTNQRDAELAELMRANPGTKEQQTRRQELLNLQNQAKTGLEAMVTELQGLLNSEDAKLTGLIKKTIEATCAELAKDKTLDVILNGENVLFGGLDVTEDLYTRLNAKPNPK